MRGDLLALGVVAAAAVIGRRGARAVPDAVRAAVRLRSIREVIREKFDLDDWYEADLGTFVLRGSCYPHVGDPLKLGEIARDALLRLGFRGGPPDDVTDDSYEFRMWRGEQDILVSILEEPGVAEGLNIPHAYLLDLYVDMNPRPTIAGTRSPWIPHEG